MNNEIKKEVLDVLSLEPIKQRDICLELEKKGIYLDPRILRKYLKDINNDFIHGKIDFVVISNKNGTYKSKLEGDIRIFNENKIKHAKSELWSAYNVNKRIEKNKNMSFSEYIEEVCAGE